MGEARRTDTRFAVEPRWVVRGLVAALLMLLAALLGNPAIARAATVTVVNDGLIRGTSTMYLFHGADGEGQLFCADRQMDAPATGAVYSGGSPTGSLALDYVMYHGYDGDDSREVYGYKGADAQLVTTYVVWCVREGGTATPDSFVGGARLQAIHRFYQDAVSYEAAGGGGPEQGCSIWWSSPSSGVQNLVGRTPGSIALRAPALARKLDSETGDEPQGDATLEGAEFTVDYYAGTYEADDLPAEPTRTWVIRTGADGVAVLDEAHLVSGDDLYVGADGGCILPLGTVAVRESKAPEGYVISDEATHVLQVRPDADGDEAVLVSLGAWSAQVDAGEHGVDDEVVRGGVKIAKVDAENGTSRPQGAASLAGAEYAIRNAGEHAVVVDGTTYQPGEDVITLVTDEEGRACTSDEALPYGSYEVRETKAPVGYNLSDDVQTFRIEKDGDVVELASALSDRVVRGDISFNKVDGQSMEPLAGVAFRLTSITTGESHLLVTDENGLATTEASWYPRAVANAADDAGDAVAPGGIWFHGRSDDALAPTDDGHGALPYDTYRIEELRCAANVGRALISRLVTISREGTVVSLGTIDDSPISIRTTAVDATTGSHEATAAGEMQVTDTIEYEGLTAGESYSVMGTLMDAATGEPVTDAEGLPVTAEASFEARGSEGTVEVTFSFDGSDLAGHDVVCFERLLDASGEVVAVHEDIEDGGQTVSVVPPDSGTMPKTGHGPLGVGMAAAGTAALASTRLVGRRGMRRRLRMRRLLRRRVRH